MARRRKAIVSWISGILVLALIWVPLARRNHSRQPSYEGRTLAEWLQLATMGGGGGSVLFNRQGEAAVLAIGTNAIPTLLVWIQYERGPIKELYGNILEHLPVSKERRTAMWRITRPADEMILPWSADQGFRLLHTNAVAAIPDLVRLAGNTNRPIVSRRAVQALARIGPPAIPELVKIVNGRNQSARAEAVVQLAQLSPTLPTVTPMLLQFAADPNDEVSNVACIMMRRVGIKGEVAVPALTNALHSKHVRTREVASEVLGLYGKDAISALPELQAILADTNQNVFRAATLAIFSIEFDAEQKGKQ